MKINEKLKKAFTLVELLIVIIIIGILMSALLPRLKWAQEKARDTSRKANLAQISTALDMYFNTEGNYPVGNCMSDISWDLVPTYMRNIPKDPQESRTTSWTQQWWCTSWVYAYTDLTKNGASRWWAAVIANVESYWRVANWVLSWNVDFSWNIEYSNNLENRICENWVVFARSNW